MSVTHQLKIKQIVKAIKPYRVLLVVALIWALEIFAFQALSFTFDYPVPMAKQIGAQVVRLVLDVFFSIGLVFLLPRALTLLAFLSFILFAQIASYYQTVFSRVLSVKTVQWQVFEGLEGARFDWSYVQGPLLWTLIGVVLLKGFLLLHGQYSADTRRRSRQIGLVALAFYGLLLGVAMWRIDRPEKLKTFVSADRFGMTYGFLPLWASEYAYLDMDHLLREAVAQRKQATDRLSVIEKPVALTGDVVLIQVESLDWQVLNHRVTERFVMPFLNRLGAQSMLFKIAAIHENGSCDSDFVMLNAVPPSPSVITYKLEAYPYQETLPQVAARAGYATVALHGNSGFFFERKRAFNRMGFTRTFFLEEMRDDLGIPTSLWGIRDDELFSVSLEMIRKHPPTERHLHYIITLTSHQPFIYLEAQQQTFLPHDTDILSRYFNSMNFVDRELERYIGSLPKGTLVVIFGDHCAMVEYPDEMSRGPESVEFVPLLIHRVGDDLAKQQVSRNQSIARSGEITLLDAATYVHRLFK